MEIKFERNWNFENYLRIGVLKIKLWKLETWKLFKNGSLENWNFENYLKMEVLKIKFKNWNFEELFKYEIWKMNKIMITKIIMIKQINVKNRILEFGNEIWKSEFWRII